MSQRTTLKLSEDRCQCEKGYSVKSGAIANAIFLDDETETIIQ